MKKSMFLTDAQLRAELARCEYCEEKPCRCGCPAGCSPADFIMAVKQGEPSDYRRAAAMILEYNPLGGLCGVVCPDRHCMSRCARTGLDRPIDIPAIQATIIQRAKEMGVLPDVGKPPANGKKIAVVGSGPAGVSAAVFLAQRGYRVTVLEKEKSVGGACRLIPEHRLAKEVIVSDIDFWLQRSGIDIKTGTGVEDPAELLQKFDAVIVAVGLHRPIKPGIPGEDLAWYSNAYLAQKPDLKGNVAVYGGGAIAVDCAVTARIRGANRVEMFFLESCAEMPLTAAERDELLRHDIDLCQRTRIKGLTFKSAKFSGLSTVKVRLKPGTTFAVANVEEIAGSDLERNDFDHAIIAIGNRPQLAKVENPGIFYCGDMVTGPRTIVEAVAHGKNTARQVDACLSAAQAPAVEKPTRCDQPVPGFESTPVSLKCDFFGREILSPFLLSAGPPTDGLEQMQKAYDAGWAGAVMKTSFTRGPIHIPGRYMHVFDGSTYGNCDNVSGHLLDRVTGEISRLVKLYPDRLTIGSTGGPVTGDDESDKKGWQGNTRRLEDAGAMAVEYSLSCPQGGDGSEGDIVSQNARLTQKIIGWVMDCSAPEVPKLFKLTGAVTSIAAIVKAVKEVLDRYPGKKAGITLANSFPVLGFRKGDKKEWEEGVVYGMSGQGILPISYLTIANACCAGVLISGNGGPMDYRSAANFLALGAGTVQFCTIAMKYGVGIVAELHNGLSYLLQERGIKSVKDLIGIAWKSNSAIADFMGLTAEKMVSDVHRELCLHCGNCARCPYQAVSLDKERIPHTDPSRCIGCSICVQKCFSGALFMRKRTEEEQQALKEN